MRDSATGAPIIQIEKPRPDVLSFGMRARDFLCESVAKFQMAALASSHATPRKIAADFGAGDNWLLPPAEDGRLTPFLSPKIKEMQRREAVERRLAKKRLLRFMNDEFARRQGSAAAIAAEITTEKLRRERANLEEGAGELLPLVAPAGASPEGAAQSMNLPERD